jgi:exosome complex component CSL4
MSETGVEGLVLPGDLLGTAEEYVPGRGTYEYNGNVYAALMGRTEIDAQNRTVSIRALHEIPHLTEGELVYARVDEIKSAMLVTVVVSSATTGRTVPGAPEGTVHISKAKESYVDELNREFAIGDILKAKVLQGYPVVKLSTQGPELGVVSARCVECHGLLTHTSHNHLVCTRCGHKEQRKVSREYGGRKPGTGPLQEGEPTGEVDTSGGQQRERGARRGDDDGGPYRDRDRDDRGRRDRRHGGGGGGRDRDRGEGRRPDERGPYPSGDAPRGEGQGGGTE